MIHQFGYFRHNSVFVFFRGVGEYGDKAIQVVHLDLQMAFKKVSYQVTKISNSILKDISIFCWRNKSLGWH